MYVLLVENAHFLQVGVDKVLGYALLKMHSYVGSQNTPRVALLITKYITWDWGDLK